jgi:hypothetical protein
MKDDYFCKKYDPLPCRDSISRLIIAPVFIVASGDDMTTYIDHAASAKDNDLYFTYFCPVLINQNTILNINSNVCRNEIKDTVVDTLP